MPQAPERLHQVAERVSQYPEVNHNYAREHHYNLWFVLTGPDRQHIERVLEAAEMIVAKEAAMAKAILAGTPMGEVMGGNYEHMLEN